MIRKKKTKPLEFKIEWVELKSPGVYTMEQYRQTLFELAKRIWPTIRNQEESQQKINLWLSRKGLDRKAADLLPMFTVLEWLESEAVRVGGYNSPVVVDTELEARRQKGFDLWNSGQSWAEVATTLDGTPETKNAVKAEITRFAKSRELSLRKGQVGAKKKK